MYVNRYFSYIYMISPMELLVNLDENPHKNQALTAKNGPQAPPRSAAQ